MLIYFVAALRHTPGDLIPANTGKLRVNVHGLPVFMHGLTDIVYVHTANAAYMENIRLDKQLAECMPFDMATAPLIQNLNCKSGRACVQSIALHFAARINKKG